MRKTLKLALAEARAMAQAALRKAGEIGVPESVCITDEGGFPIVLERMDGGRITGPQIAWNKAFTASGHKRSTHLFTRAPSGPALPGNEAFGIQLSFEGRFAAFVGGPASVHFCQADTNCDRQRALDVDGDGLTDMSAGEASNATAKTYLTRLLAKLDARDRLRLVILAYETGLVTPSS